LALRDKLSEGYNEEMKELNNKNAKILDEIIDTIGYPTIDKVGIAVASYPFLLDYVTARFLPGFVFLEGK
jgi:hypothetical protein